MKNHLLIDNWTLQNAGELLTEGFRGDTASEIRVGTDRAGFSYAEVSADVINVETLFQVINHLVFVDEIFVDDGGVHTWNDFDILSTLTEQRLVIPKPFQTIKEQWLPARERILEEFLICQQMRDLHARNLSLWVERQECEDPYFSQLLWGGAGMLARAHQIGIPYAAHPMRENWFSQMDTIFGRRSAHERMIEFISKQRIKVLNRVDNGGYLTRLNLPPVAAIVIQEAKEPADILRVALQLRADFVPLRKWLGEFQQALDNDDNRGVLEREKILQSVARNIDASYSAFPMGDTTVQVSLGFLKATGKICSPVNSLLNRIGVRAMLNRLVLAPSGAGILRKLRKLFGEENSRIGVDFERDYLAEASRNAPLQS